MEIKRAKITNIIQKDNKVGRSLLSDIKANNNAAEIKNMCFKQ